MKEVTYAELIAIAKEINADIQAGKIKNVKEIEKRMKVKLKPPEGKI